MSVKENPKKKKKKEMIQLNHESVLNIDHCVWGMYFSI